MNLRIFGIPHLRDIYKTVSDDAATNITMLFSAKGVSFAVAEQYKSKICVVSWYQCREVFHTDYPISNHIFVSHKKNQFNFVKKFLIDFESLLGIDEKSKFFKTNKKTCTMIVISDFWKQRLKFTLLTLLLRFCVKFNKSKFNINDLCKCNLLKETIPAVSLLLEGNLHYCGRKDSWHDQFKNLNLEESAKYLRRI